MSFQAQPSRFYSLRALNRDSPNSPQSLEQLSSSVVFKCNIYLQIQGTPCNNCFSYLTDLMILENAAFHFSFKMILNLLRSLWRLVLKFHYFPTCFLEFIKKINTNETVIVFSVQGIIHLLLTVSRVSSY